ncbi:MAG: ECF transporter S component [Ruminococcus sp.]|jgi:uncharacterized membrane protein|nr:ECF transporter S component [Ruminococcus sp.]
MKQANSVTKTMADDKILKLVQLSILTAVTILMSLTPLGYLPVGPLVISFLMVPVVVGAIITGPAGGAFLGLVFGLTSFSTCVTGTDAFGAMLFGLNPVGAFLVCVPTRVLAGLLPGLFAKLLSNKMRYRILYPSAALMGSLCNTFFFLGTLLLIFGKNTEVAAVLDFDGTSIILYILATVAALNGILEATACTVVGAGLSGIIDRFSRKK